ncbi:PAAR-like protein [Hoylesella pleuritidis]|jgi:lipase family protein|uniref:PF14107 domain protein n=1 Tax=Hoylesella pleuritidis F0068 TaxID=1081904 RepID=U2MPK6_9BACT|nr:PAAR-like protein [Hoylesella pleuritidis]ERK03580.1 PF14107 domain protein [Hoylesella pleuritidis F0068]
MSSQYIQDGDMTVCTSGAHQALIKVTNQTTVMRASSKLLATEKDRMDQCYVCLKLTAAGAMIGALVGLHFGGASLIVGAVGALAGGIIGGMRGYENGGVWGAVKGAAKGIVKGGIAGTGIMGILGGIAGGALTNMLMKVINPCAFLTSFSQWSKVHPKVKICGNRALLQGATLTCKLGGLITIIKPNYAMASDMLCLSFFAYNRKTKEEKEEESYKELAPYDHYDLEKSLEGLSDDQKQKLKSKQLEGYTKLGDAELRKLGISQSDLQKRKHGFKADLYKDKNGNYVLAFRGTNSDPRDKGERDLPLLPDWSKDWVDDNVAQGVGMGSEQYKDAIDLSRNVKNKVGKDRLTITGHSLGGGLATAGGAATGCETYAFNPAGVHPNTYKMYGVKNPDTSKVHTYYSNQDFLNMGNNNLALMPNSAGERIQLYTSDKFDFATGHDLPLLLKAIEAEQAKQGTPIITNDL